METVLKEAINLNKLLNNLEKIEEQIKIVSTEDEKKELEIAKKDLLLQIKEMGIRKQIQDNGLTDKLVKAVASLSSERNLIKKPSQEEKQSEKENENKYTLTSEYIVSNKTGQTINLKYLTVSEKIELIYEHTGEVISYQDPYLANQCDRSCQDFISYLSTTLSKKELKKRYGSNWQEVVTENYKKGYNDYLKYHIEKTKEKVDQKNYDEYKKMETNVINSEKKADEVIKERDNLIKENDTLKEKVNLLVEEIDELRSQKREDLVEYRSALTQVINNKENSNVFEFTPQEKSKILGALGISFEYDENKRNGIGIDNDYNLVVDGSTEIAQTARQMMICKNLGIRVTANFNGQILSNTSFENEQQVIDNYTSNLNQGKAM